MINVITLIVPFRPGQENKISGAQVINSYTFRPLSVPANPVASGVSLYRLQAGTEVKTRKVLILR